MNVFATSLENQDVCALDGVLVAIPYLLIMPIYDAEQAAEENATDETILSTPLLPSIFLLIPASESNWWP